MEFFWRFPVELLDGVWLFVNEDMNYVWEEEEDVV